MTGINVGDEAVPMVLDPVPNHVGDDADERPAEDQHPTNVGQGGEQKEPHMRPLQVHVDVVQRVGVYQEIEREEPVLDVEVVFRTELVPGDVPGIGQLQQDERHHENHKKQGHHDQRLPSDAPGQSPVYEERNCVTSVSHRFSILYPSLTISLMAFIAVSRSYSFSLSGSLE